MVQRRICSRTEWSSRSLTSALPTVSQLQDPAASPTSSMARRPPRRTSALSAHSSGPPGQISPPRISAAHSMPQLLISVPPAVTMFMVGVEPTALRCTPFSPRENHYRLQQPRQERSSSKPRSVSSTYLVICGRGLSEEESNHRARTSRSSDRRLQCPQKTRSSLPPSPIPAGTRRIAGGHRAGEAGPPQLLSLHSDRES